MNRLSMRGKLIAVTVASSAVALVLAGAILVSRENIDYESRITQQYETQSKILGSSVAAALLFADAQTVKEHLAALAANPEILAAAVYDAGGARLAEYTHSGAGAELLPVSLGDVVAGAWGERIVIRSPVGVEGQNIGTVVLRARMEPVASRALRYGSLIMIVMAVSLLVTLPLSLWLSSAISSPVRRMADAASKLSEGDLTVRLDPSGARDEMGVLTSTFAAMVDSLRALNREIRDALEVMASSVGSIVTSAGQVSSGADDTARAVQSASETVDDARRSAHEASEEAQQVSDSARNASEVARKGREAVDRSVKETGKAQAQMEQMTTRVVELSAQTENIAEIIATVDDLAEQSNLLAVNAAIEAAGAGEQGRSFAVVAREMRALSEQSKQATVQVRSIVRHIHSALEATVSAVRQAMGSVESSAKESAAAGDAIRALEASVNQAARVATRIAQASERQVANMEQATRAMAEIRETAEQNVSGARHTETAARTIEDLGRKLGLLVARYRA